MYVYTHKISVFIRKYTNIYPIESEKISVFIRKYPNRVVKKHPLHFRKLESSEENNLKYGVGYEIHKSGLHTLRIRLFNNILMPNPQKCIIIGDYNPHNHATIGDFLRRLVPAVSLCEKGKSHHINLLCNLPTKRYNNIT